MSLIEIKNLRKEYSDIIPLKDVTVSIEKGEGNPTMDVLNRILDTLGLQISIGVKKHEETENL